MYYGYYMDWTFILVILGFAITMIAQVKMKSTFAKYKDVPSQSGITGAEAARKILLANGIYDVTVQPAEGSLTDHYDPSKKIVRLSEDVYEKSTLAAIGIAAHECGHAIQDSEEYVPLKARTALVPIASIGSSISWYLILLGAIIGGLGSPIVEMGIVLFAVTVGFQLITLPVEYNASNRAVAQLSALGILTEDEQPKTKAVLSAAALTYVAAAAAGILQLLRLILIFGGRGSRRR